MTRFSITEALSYSFSMYRRHFLSVLAAAACMAFGMWFCGAMPEFISHKLVTPGMSEIAALVQQQKQLGPEKTHELLRALFDNVSFTQLLLMVIVYILSWFLYAFLCLGFVRVFLHLKDHQRVDISQMFHGSVQQVVRFSGAVLLIFCRIGGWLFVGALGVIGVTAVTKKLLFLSQLSGLFVIALVIAGGAFLVYWYVPYTFLPFVLVDQPTLGVRASLKQCQFLCRANRGKVVLALAAMSSILIPLVLIFIVPAMILALRVGIGTTWAGALGQAACILVMYPPFFLFNSFLYRKLANKE